MSSCPAGRGRKQPRVLLSSGFVDSREEAASTGTRPHGFPVRPKPYRRAELARHVRRVLDSGLAEG